MDPDEPRRDLLDAIEHLYAVFARYEAHPSMHGCPHCVGDEDKHRLLARPLRELQPADLKYYAWKAMTTFGTEVEFKHFLPRLLEVLISPNPPDVDAPVVAGKFPYGEWRTWPAEEQGAVETFWTAHWHYFLQDLSAPGDPGTWLNCLAILFPTLRPFLEHWRNELVRSIVARRRLAQWLCEEDWDELPVFWEGPKSHWREFRCWMRDSATADLARQALAEYFQTPAGIEYTYILRQYNVWLGVY